MPAIAAAAEHAAYELGWRLVLPFACARLAWKGRHRRDGLRGWGERLGYGPMLSREEERPLHVHAVSVGEMQAALPLLELLARHYPSLPLAVTTTTATGRERARRALGGALEPAYLPFDLRGAVERFLDRRRPRAVVLMETEVWPALIAAGRERGIPFVLANARLSERSWRRYRRAGRVAPHLLRESFGGLAAVGAQSEADAMRLEELGVPGARIRVTGSLKFDVEVPASVGEAGAVLRRRWGVERGVWVAASTHEGEEQAVLAAHRRVLEGDPGALLVLVPRHPERFERVAALCARAGFRVARRSRPGEDAGGAEVFLGDTMGELPMFCAGADVAFVGGSFVPVGGHNPLEPAQLGKPVLLGPFHRNFQAIVEGLGQAGGGRTVAGAAELAEGVGALLMDANLRHQMGERARAYVASNRGAGRRTLELLEGALQTLGPARSA